MMKLKPTPTIKVLLTAFLLTAGFIAAPGTAGAHKVSVFAWVEGDTVYTLSKFSGGKKVKSGRITVRDPEGKKLLEGQTNDQGEFAFKIPQKTGLRVELAAGPGHKGFWMIPREEMMGSFKQSTLDASEKTISKKPAEVGRVSGNADAHLEATIEKVLDKKLKPVMKLLAESRQSSPSLAEIFGGIGYIIGLVGIAAYFKNRQKE